MLTSRKAGARSEHEQVVAGLGELASEDCRLQDATEQCDGRAQTAVRRAVGRLLRLFVFAQTDLVEDSCQQLVHLHVHECGRFGELARVRHGGRSHFYTT